MRFIDYFSPQPGDTKQQILGRFDAMFQQLDETAKKGYEHEASQCDSGVADAGGWIDPVSGVCSACGFYVGRVAAQISALRQLEAQFKELPESYVYGGTDGRPEQDSND